MNIEPAYIISIRNTGRSKDSPHKYTVEQFDGSIIENKTVGYKDQLYKWPAADTIRRTQIIVQVAMIVIFIIGCIILAFPVR